jgi:hypothetical protein
VHSIIEASGITVEAGDPGANQAALPLSFKAAEREILGLWLPARAVASRLQLVRVIAGHAPPRDGEVRRRIGARIAVARLDGSLEQALKSADLVVLDADSGDMSLDEWMRLAVERELGASVIVVTTLVMQAYRCDRVVLALWSVPDVLSALDALATNMLGAARELLTEDRMPRRVAVLAADLLRGNRACRDLIGHAKRAAGDAEERLRVSELAARAAEAMLDDRILENLIAQAESL